MRRIKELDAIRGLAAVAIVIYHIWLPSWEILGSAVDLFFVLSGYLITTILLNHAATDRSVIAFYARRFLRIAPIYYLALLAVVVINRWMPAPESVDGLPYYLTYTQKVPTYLGHPEPEFITSFRHTWTLAIEEQFYLLWPALLWVLGRRRLPWLSLAFIGVAVWARAAGLNRWVLATNCDGLALGGLLAGFLFDLNSNASKDTLAPSAAASMHRWGIAAIGFFACLAMVVGYGLPRLVPTDQIMGIARSLRVLGINLGYTLIIGVLAVAAGHPWLKVLRSAPLVYLGVISYGLYLYHHIVLFTWDDLARAHGWAINGWSCWAKAALSFGVAALSWRYIERPILVLKHRFEYRLAEASATVETDSEANAKLPRAVGVSLR